ncbi:hypothetical protein [Gimesia maris]|uniref:hypothetical protein n=1 Tax=Gimesia maris TaxID=122 RepID=UPI0012B954E5|nr:hypothetical protein [Gimesia maris]
MNQPEFWLTVKDGGVYPDRVESGATVGVGSTVYSSNLIAQSFDTDRTCRYYCRKLTNVQYDDTPGLQTLTYDLTDIYGPVFMLDITDQPLEGTVLACIRINYQVFAFGSDTRHDGGTP